MGTTGFNFVVQWLYLVTTTLAASSLPATYTPTQYNLLLSPSLTTLNYTGTVAITIQTSANANDTELSSISLHKDSSVIVADGDVSVTDSAQGVVSVSGTQYAMNTQIYKINLNRTLSRNSTYTLTITFASALRKDKTGLHYGSYTYNNTISYYVAANFYPIYARLAFPCFDEPQLKAVFNVRITRRYNEVAVTTMPVDNSTTGTDLITDTFTATPMISPHSLSLFVAVSDSMNSVSSTLETGTILKLWKPSSMTTDFSNQNFNAYQNYVDTLIVSHPLGSLNIFVLTDLKYESFGGFGMIFLREDILLPYSGYKLQHTVDSILVILDQMLRQYYSNYVTPAWWSDIWLTESVIYYFKYLILYYMVPAVYPDLTMAVKVRQRGLAMDIYPYSGFYPLVEKYLSTTDEILRAVNDDVKKNKGAAVLFMMDESFSGVFSSMLFKDYLTTKKYSTSTLSELLQMITQNDTNASEMESWFTSNSYPVVSFTRNGSNVLLTQKVLTSNNSNPDPTIWKIPISFTFKSRPESDWMKTDPQYWLTSASLNISVKNLTSSDWILFNIKSGGFYRVQYGNNDIQLIQNQLKSNYSRINEINHAAIIDDIMALAMLRGIDYVTALEFIKETSSHARHVPWVSTINALRYLKAAMFNQSNYNAFTSYVKDIIVHPYGVVGYLGWDYEAQDTRMLRSLILPWACEFQVGNCVSGANSTLDKLSSLIQSRATSNSNGTLYDEDILLCEAFKSLNETQFQYYLTYYKANHAQDEIQYYIACGLGCARNNNLATILNAIDNGDIYNEDIEMVFTKTYSQLENLNAVLYYIARNDTLVKLQQRYGSQLLQKVIIGIGDQIFTISQKIILEDLAKLITDKLLIQTINYVAMQTSPKVMWTETDKHALNQAMYDVTKSSATSIAYSIFLLCLSLIGTYLMRNL